MTHTQPYLKTVLISKDKKQNTYFHAQIMFHDRIIPLIIGDKGTTLFKKEGDMKTPLTVLKPLWGYYNPERKRRPKTFLPFFPLKKNMLWCDDPQSGAYNKLLKNKTHFSYEKLMREDRAYDQLIILDYNMGMTKTQPAIKKHKGSAIFLHQTKKKLKEIDSGTEGCLALAPTHFNKILPFISLKTRFIIQS